MNGIVLILLDFAGVAPEQRERRAANLLSAARRHTLSAMGPISVSAAHFVAALILLRTLPRSEFGMFSFLLVLSPFFLSVCGALFAPPIARGAAIAMQRMSDEGLTLFKASAVFSVLVAVAVAAAMWISGAAPLLTAAFGLYGAVMSLRWFARCWTYGQAQTARVLCSDLAYSALVCIGLLLLLISHRLTISSAASTLLLAAFVGLLALDARHLHVYWVAIRRGRLAPFVSVWREMSGWAVLGVALSEASVNAHAYLVTFIVGPHAFAVLAVGALLMRPVSLVLSALPDMERPLMARALRNGDRLHAFRIVNEFRTAAGTIWAATAALAAGLLIWFPHLVIKQDYPLSEVVTVVTICASLTALRAFRTPDSVLLQAAGEFRKLIRPGLWSSAVSLIATFVLLILAGPIVALLGILLGELVATERTFALVRAWRRA
jgi:O-antigen/teichoic acid export membrane protein